MKRMMMVGLVLVVSAVACTTSPGSGGITTADSSAGGGSSGATVVPTGGGIPAPSGEAWCLGDSRSVNYDPLTGQGWIGWAQNLGVNCRSFGVAGTGFAVSSGWGPDLPTHFAELVNARHTLPATVYVSAGVNDAFQGVDARAAIAQFHDELAALGIQQVWATAPYTRSDTAANALLEKLNAAEPWARDCAGADPNPATIDGVHPSQQASREFAECFMGRSL